MAALTITAANVAVGASTTKTRLVQAGEALTQGQAVYLNTTDNKWYRADSNASATTARAGAIVLSPAATNGYAIISVPAELPGQSLINLGATLVVGQVYCVGATAGSIVPITDLTTGDYVTILGVAQTTALLDHQIVVSNTVKP